VKKFVACPIVDQYTKLIRSGANMRIVKFTDMSVQMTAAYATGVAPVDASVTTWSDYHAALKP
jgi:hypothetical protein